ELRDRVEQDLVADGVPIGAWEVVLEADIRYAGQRSDLTIVYEDDADEASFVSRFEAEYARRYGHGSTVRSAVPELVALRAVGTRTVLGEHLLPSRAARTTTTTGVARSERAVRLERTGAPGVVTAYDDSLAPLPPGRTPGPLLIDRHDTTVWIPEG